MLTIQHFWEACQLFNPLHWQTSLLQCSCTATGGHHLKAMLCQALQDMIKLTTTYSLRDADCCAVMPGPEKLLLIFLGHALVLCKSVCWELQTLASFSRFALSETEISAFPLLEVPAAGQGCSATCAEHVRLCMNAL